MYDHVLEGDVSMSSRLLDNLNGEVKESIDYATDDPNPQAEGKVDGGKKRFSIN